MNPLRQYPFRSSLGPALAFFLAAWPVFTRKTFPEALEPLLGSSPSPLYHAALMALGVLVALLQMAILVAVRAKAPAPPGLSLENLLRLAEEEEREEGKRFKEAMALPSVPVPSAVPGRALVTTTTPLQLVSLFKQHAEHRANEKAAPYVGKWFRIQGKIFDIGDKSFSAQVDGVYRTDRYHVITVLLDPHERSDIHQVRLLFKLEQAAQISHLDKGQTIAVEARLKKVEQYYVTYVDCELVTPV